jgi:hypothetical protein
MTLSRRFHSTALLVATFCIGLPSSSHAIEAWHTSTVTNDGSTSCFIKELVVTR